MTWLCLECACVFPGILPSGKQHKCPNKDCSGQTIQLDDNMVSIVYELNKKGYTTQYCCGGHATDEDVTIYIKFAPGIKIPKKLPIGYVQIGSTIRRTFPVGFAWAEYQVCINLAINDLIEWVYRLPDLNDKEVVE